MLLIFITSSEDTDRHLITIVNVIHTTLFISSIPLFNFTQWIPPPRITCTYFLAWLATFVRKLTWSSHYPASSSWWTNCLNYSLFFPFKLALEVCKAQYSRKGLVFRLTFLLLFSNQFSRWRWHRMTFVDMEPTVFGLRTRTKCLIAFVPKGRQSSGSFSFFFSENILCVDDDIA